MNDREKTRKIVAMFLLRKNIDDIFKDILDVLDKELIQWAYKGSDKQMEKASEYLQATILRLEQLSDKIESSIKELKDKY